MEVFILGSSCAIPTVERNLPSVAIRHLGKIYLFDCGEGTQREMLKNNLNIAKVKAIFISHMHADHFIGVGGLIRTLALTTSGFEIKIFSPFPMLIKNFLSFAQASTNIEIKKIKEGKVFEEKDFEVFAFKLKHTISTYGFVFKEKDKIKFKKEKANKLGIKGKMFKELLEKRSIKVGNKTIKLEEVSYVKKGKKIAYVADTSFLPKIVDFVKDSDLLIHEATYSKNEEELAKKRKHSTAEDAAKIAKLARVKKLLLFHISNRYRDPKILEKEARKIFKNSFLAYDGMKIEI
ncbi:MAG: ribonuclease Z [Candidatus Micrarchaeia archaeon]